MPATSAPLFFTLAQTPAPSPGPASQPPGGIFGSPYFMLLPMFVIFYFLLIRPQKLQARKLADMIGALKNGDKVITSGGIHGTVAAVKEGGTLSLRIAKDVHIEVDKAAIASVNKPAVAKA